MAILKNLSSLCMGNRGKRCNIKVTSIDLPLSQNVFTDTFPVDYCGEDNFKCTVSVTALNEVFGEHWYIYHFPNSCTRKIIIGLVSLHFRKKTIAKGQIADSRYFIDSDRRSLSCCLMHKLFLLVFFGFYVFSECKEKAW